MADLDFGNTADQDLTALEQTLADATPGPWYADPSTGVREIWAWNENEMILGENIDGYMGPSEADAKLIVTARNWLPSLIARIRELEAR